MQSGLFRYAILCFIVISVHSNDVLVWLADGMTSVDQEGYNEMVHFLTNHKDSVTIVSQGAMYLFMHNGTVAINNTLITMHEAWKQNGFKVIPIIYAIDSTVEIYENIFANKDNIINLLVGEAVHHDFEGFSIQQQMEYVKCQMLPNATDPYAPPSIQDGIDFAAFLDEFAEAMHRSGKILTVDSLSVATACHSPKDPNPCPWIRKFWNYDALTLSQLDKSITMDTYTRNDTEFLLSIEYNRFWWENSRLGVGLCPWCFYSDKIIPSKAKLDLRFNRIASDGVTELDLWEIGRDSTIREWWEPWWPYLSAFVQNQTLNTIN